MSEGRVSNVYYSFVNVRGKQNRCEADEAPLEKREKGEEEPQVKEKLPTNN